MTDHTPFDSDDELRELLRTSDPARSLPPANAAALAHLLEDIMSTDLDVRPPLEEGTRSTGTRGRNPLTWLVAAAAATVIAGAAGFALSNGGPDPAPTATDPVSQAPAEPDAAPADPGAPLAGQTTDLTAPAATQGRCMAPNADFIASQQQAFAGTVTAVQGDSVTLQATEVYAGQVGETVVVQAPSPELQALIASTKFEVGGNYLVSATDGVVAVCGMSGQASAPLQTLYNEAFAR